MRQTYCIGQNQLWMSFLESGTSFMDQESSWRNMICNMQEKSFPPVLEGGTVKRGKISHLFTFQSIYLRAILLFSAIFFSMSCMNIRTNDSQFTKMSWLSLVLVFFVNYGVADLCPFWSNFSHLLYFIDNLWSLTSVG